MAATWPKKPPKDEPAEKAGLSENREGPPQAFEAREPGRGRLAARPLHIPAKGWRDILWRTWKEVVDDKLQIVAAGVTFYALLAAFPALGAFVSLYGLVADVEDARKLLSQMAGFLPPGAIDMIGAEMLRMATRHDATLSVAFGLGIVLSIWSAKAGVQALFDGLNIAYDEVEKRGFLRRTLLTIGFTAGAILFLLAVSALLIGIPAVMGRFGYTPQETFWLLFRWVLLFGLAVASFALIYRYGPSRQRAKWVWVSAGGLFGASMWLLGSLAFSAYVEAFANYDRTYGPLGTVIGFMMWMWVSVFIVLLGAELNSEMEHQTALDTTTGAPLPMGERGATMADTVGLAFTGFNRRKAKAEPKPTWSSVRGRPAV